MVEECLRLALQAPSGMNNQRWHWVVVTDQGKKNALAEVYQEAFDAVYPPEVVTSMDAEQRRIHGSARYLATNLARVPVLVIPCQWTRIDDSTVFRQAGWWASILPAVWSFMLALRSRGLGSCITTMHLTEEERVAGLLGIPYERCTQVALLPVAHTLGTDFTSARRRPLEDVVHWNAW